MIKDTCREAIRDYAKKYIDLTKGFIYKVIYPVLSISGCVNSLITRKMEVNLQCDMLQHPFNEHTLVGGKAQVLLRAWKTRNTHEFLMFVIWR